MTVGVFGGRVGGLGWAGLVGMGGLGGCQRCSTAGRFRSRKREISAFCFTVHHRPWYMNAGSAQGLKPPRSNRYDAAQDLHPDFQPPIYSKLEALEHELR